MSTIVKPLGRAGRAMRTRYVLLGLLLVLLGSVSCTGPAAKPDRQRPFTLVMLPDTQFYSKSHPDLFYAQTDWIKQNRDKENIVFVTHAGDIVNDRTKIMSQWTVAAKAMATLDGVVPWGVAIGNHDYDTGGIENGVAKTWLRYFGPQRFEDCAWFGGSTPNGLNSYQFFSGGGVDFIIFHLEVNVPDDTIRWVGDALKRYPTRAAIVMTHVYLRGIEGLVRDPDHRYRPNGNSGEAIWTKLIRVHPQIFMVLCAHVGRTGEYHQIVTNDNGGQVLEMLADYQRRERGGDGWLRLIRFVPTRREIQIRTYSPVLDRFETDADSQSAIPWELPEACRTARSQVAAARGWQCDASCVVPFAPMSAAGLPWMGGRLTCAEAR